MNDKSCIENLISTIIAFASLPLQAPNFFLKSMPSSPPRWFYFEIKSIVNLSLPTFRRHTLDALLDNTTNKKRNCLEAFFGCRGPVHESEAASNFSFDTRKGRVDKKRNVCAFRTNQMLLRWQTRDYKSCLTGNKSIDLLSLIISFMIEHSRADNCSFRLRHTLAS